MQVVAIEGTTMDPALQSMTSAHGVGRRVTSEMSVRWQSELLMQLTPVTNVGSVDTLSTYLDHAPLWKIIVIDVGKEDIFSKCVK